MVIPLAVRFVLKALVLPPGGLLLLAALGLWVAGRRPRLGRALCACALLALWLLLTPYVAERLALAVERYPALDPAHLTPAQRGAQAIVILGGGVRLSAPEYGGDTPDFATLERLIEGAHVARVIQLPILVSGAGREAHAMAHFLEEDLRQQVRWVEDASGDTHDNAVFSARILRAAGIDRVILVTSSVHLPRSVAEFRAAGLSVIPAPAAMPKRSGAEFRDFLPSVRALEESYAVFYEWGGDIVRGGS